MSWHGRVRPDPSAGPLNSLDSSGSAAVDRAEPTGRRMIVATVTLLQEGGPFQKKGEDTLTVISPRSTIWVISPCFGGYWQ